MQIPPKNAAKNFAAKTARLRIKSSLLALSLGALVSTNATMATTEVAMDLTKMTNEAEAIITAEVLSTSPQTLGSSVQTVVKLRVTDSFKGQADEVVEVVLPGGLFTSGRFKLGMVNAGVPTLFVNQNGLYFLNQTSAEDTYTLVGLQQGYMSIRNTDTGPVIQNSATGGKVISLPEMKAKIMNAEEN